MNCESRLGVSRRNGFSNIIFEEGATFQIGGKFVEILAPVTQPSFINEDVSVLSISMETPKLGAFVNQKFKPVLPFHKTCLSTTEQADDSYLLDKIVMPRPPAGHIFKYNQACSPVRDVILDPHLASRMRPHQIDGTIFLYECVLGFRSHGGTGAILADSMGLGKSIQTIALIWTLLKQGPYENESVIKRCLVVCPSSLVLNWRNEFEKWLGVQRIRPYCIIGDTRVEDFSNSSSNNVLILSYEMLIRNIDVLSELSFDLIVCDEAHRLRNTNIKTTMGIGSLRIPRKILLTGTPLQNDMEEFFALVEFSNPGVLGPDKEHFRKRFVEPITVARDQGASQDVIDYGCQMSLVLQRLTQSFILRRTEIVNTRYLPPKDEYLIFCSATEMQLQLYNLLLECQMLQKHLETGGGAGIEAISCILLLRKLCNDPILLIKHVIDKRKIGNKVTDSTFLGELYRNLISLSSENSAWAHLISGNIDLIGDQIYSGKLWVTAQMLQSLGQTEKIVLASHFTKTLDLLNKLCEILGLKLQRIDGNTPSATRMKIVNKFNQKIKCGPPEVLLLSCKAGGEGLNLTGANKILMYDLDWNPAIDEQTMARVWRDGQKGRVSVYRLITVGTVEECILQRQISKQQLSTSLVDLSSSSFNQIAFSKNELKDIFTLHLDHSNKQECWTHKLLNCSCQATTKPAEDKSDLIDSSKGIINENCQLGLRQIANKVPYASSIAQLNSWNHWIGKEEIGKRVTDKLILNSLSQIACVFTRSVDVCEDK